MASNRRQWQESLRNKLISEEKKPKVKILSNVLYTKSDEASPKKQCRASKTLVTQEDNDNQHTCISPNPHTEIEDAKTPKQNTKKVTNLTPTFRNPQKYIEATQQVMKNISPISNEHPVSAYDDNLPANIPSATASCDLIDNQDSLNYQSFENEPIVSSDIINYKSFEINVIVETHDNICNEEINATKSSTDRVPTEHLDLILLNTKQSTFSLHGIEQADLSLPVAVQSDDALAATEQSDSALLAIEHSDSVLLAFKQSDTTLLDTEQSNSCMLDVKQPNTAVLTQESHSESDTESPKKKKILRRSRRKLNFNKSYLDFIDDEPDTLIFNEAFPSECSSYEISETSTSSEDEGKTKKNKRTSKKLTKDAKKKPTGKENEQFQTLNRKSKAMINKENLAKKKKGEAFLNKNGEFVEGKRMKPNPCIGKNCQNKCENIQEERRENLFKYFWNLGNHQRRKDWIAQCAIKKNVKRPDKNIPSNRSCVYEYFINENEGRRRVCQKFLMATLDISQKFILYTLNSVVGGGFAKEDMRGKLGHHNKTPEELLEYAKQFVLSLPLLPSHYCRRDSQRLYLPEEFKNITNFYRIYQNHFDDCGKIMSFKVFSVWFKKTFNIGFHIPKKDKCSLCVSAKTYDVLNETEMEKLKIHEEEKNESYKRFKFHQSLNSLNENVICASFDLQKVLNTPYGESMMLYYSRKIAVYNFTIYESGTQNGLCYVWNETDAHRGANEIATCLYDYIIDVDKRGKVNKILFYCDSCYGQNKNKTVLAMLRYALNHSKNLEVIQINYLIPGHTYMPVDSMHATIESSVKKSIVWAPSQWPTIIELARKNPRPYKVTSMVGSDFLGFEDLVNYTFKKIKNLQVSKISIVTLKKNELNKMFIKYSMLPNAPTVEIDVGDIEGASLKYNLYPSKLSISTKKFADLKKMVEKNVIPKRFAEEYLKLKVSAKKTDCLPDTDEEDIVD